jgi:hypothetical protein
VTATLPRLTRAGLLAMRLDEVMDRFGLDVDRARTLLHATLGYRTPIDPARVWRRRTEVVRPLPRPATESAE